MAYLPHLLVCLALEVATSDTSVAARPNESLATNQPMREWTDASGTRHARAALLRVEGEKLWLKTLDGRLTTTTLGRLSVSDRAYVASHPLGGAAAQRPSPVPNVPEMLKHFPSLKEATAWFKPSESDSRPRVVPAALVYARISRGFLEDYVDRAVHTRGPVHDFILGTRIEGESQTDGQIHLLLHPMFGKLSGEIAFDGTVHAQTVGYNGPAIIHSILNSRFRARKPISMGPSGLSVAPATACVTTNLQTTGVATTLPRLRGRIANRIASRRTAASHDEAEAISAQHTARTIREDFDKRVNRSVGNVRELFPSAAQGFEIAGDRAKTIMRFRSTTDYVEMAMLREGASAEEYKLRPPSIEGNPDFAIRLNRAILGTAIGDSQTAEQLSPWLVKLLQARVAGMASAARGSSTESAGDVTQWSINRDWVAMEFTDGGRSDSPGR
jgi:hypothetical protein